MTVYSLLLADNLAKYYFDKKSTGGASHGLGA